MFFISKVDFWPRIYYQFPGRPRGSWEFGGQLSADNDCPRTIFEIVRCPWNTRTILEFCGQFSEKKLNFKFWRTISEFGGQFQNLADNLRIWRTI
jgi:hypothetical protein